MLPGGALPVYCTHLISGIQWYKQEETDIRGTPCVCGRKEGEKQVLVLEKGRVAEKENWFPQLLPAAPSNIPGPSPMGLSLSLHFALSLSSHHPCCMLCAWNSCLYRHLHTCSLAFTFSLSSSPYIRVRFDLDISLPSSFTLPRQGKRLSVFVPTTCTHSHP